MDGPDWKRKNVLGPQAVNGVDLIMRAMGGPG